MRRSLAKIWLFFALSPQNARLFYATSLAHVLMKIGLGLCLVANDGYGASSLVAPPWVLVFTGGDVLVCFGVAKLLDVLPWGRSRVLQAGVLSALFLFLVANFIVHSYFKAFVNRGLLEFNGASSVEITDYALVALNRFSVPFIAATALLFIGLVMRGGLANGGRAQASRDVHNAPFHAGVLAVAGLSLAYVGTLSQGQCGFLAKNPGYDFVKSYASSEARAVQVVRATPAEVAAFPSPHRGVRGTYDSSLDVRVPSQRGKNVLFVLIESLPLEQTSLGGQKGNLPVLAELAEEGVSFENFRTVFPATSRSFLTYHCGIYPTTGLATATKYQPGYACDSIVDMAKQHGYRTGFFTAPMFTYDNLHKSEVVAGYDTYADFLKLQPRMKKLSADAPAVDEQTVVDAMLEFVDQRGAQPFFATYFMFWNHAPYRLPFEDISGLAPHDRYLRTLAYLDGVLRGVLQSLKDRHVLDDTVVVVAADHGEGFGIHHGNVNHVGHVYEDDVRIPFVVHVPGLGAHKTARQASNVDVAPTLSALLGFERAHSWQGQDMLAQSFEERPTLIFGRGSFATNAIVDGNLKYIEYPAEGRRMLYDLATDPHEQRDLAGLRGSDADAYHRLIGRWMPVVETQAWTAKSSAHHAKLTRDYPGGGPTL